MNPVLDSWPFELWAYISHYYLIADSMMSSYPCYVTIPNLWINGMPFPDVNRRCEFDFWSGVFCVKKLIPQSWYSYPGVEQSRYIQAWSLLIQVSVRLPIVVVRYTTFLYSSYIFKKNWTEHTTRSQLSRWKFQSKLLFSLFFCLINHAKATKSIWDGNDSLCITKNL